VTGGPVVIRVWGPLDGTRTPFDGQYLVEYDPDRSGHDPEGRPMLAHVVTTPHVADARTFPTAVEAWACWRQQSSRWPTRPDGLPNRPLTAFTIEVESLAFARSRGKHTQ
jgi:hypothetical protein